MNSNDCTIYWIDPEILGEEDNPPPDDPIQCTSCDCYCGYVQFESLLGYLKELNHPVKQDAEDYTEFEYKVREQIVEISRLFDVEAGVKPGYFSKAHYQTTKTVLSNSTRYLKIPDFVPGTLEVRTHGNFLLDPSVYMYKDGYLLYMPCTSHSNTSCSSDCGGSSKRRPIKWPDACYYVTARWGKECADLAVQMAVRDYLIERYRLQDPVIAMINGIPVTRTFKAPHSWTSYISNFKGRRKIYSQFAIA